MTVTRPATKTTWKSRTLEKIRNRIDARRVLDLNKSPFAVL